MNKFIIFLIAIVILSTDVYTQDCVPADSIYELTFRDRSYEFIKVKKTWEDAVHCADERGGNLVWINSELKNEGIFYLLTKELKSEYGIEILDNDKNTDEKIWLGAFKPFSKWHWARISPTFGSIIAYESSFYQGTGKLGDNDGEKLNDKYSNWGGNENDTYFPAPYESSDVYGDAVAMTLVRLYQQPGNILIADSSQWINIKNDSENYFLIEYDCENEIQSNFDTTLCSGETFDFNGRIINEAGTYIDTVDSYSFCDSIVTAEVLFTEIDTSVKVEEKRMISLDNTADIYTWYNCDTDTKIEGENKFFYIIDKTGNYKVELEKNACVEVSDCYFFCVPASTEINESICKNSSVIINGEEYTEAGSYIQNLKQVGFDCDSILEIDIDEVEINANISQDDNILIAGEFTAEYQWYNCETDESIDGATSREFEPENNGDYKVVIEKDGCKDTSDCYTFELTNIETGKSIDDINLTQTNNKLQITGLTSISQIKIYNLNSKLVHSEKSYDGKIDISTLEPGIYFVRIQDGSKLSTYKFFKY